MKSNKKLIVIIAAVIIVIGGMIGAYIAFSGGDIFSEGVNDIEIKVINEDMGEYMATGVKTAKIVAERENEEIFFSLGEKKFSSPKRINDNIKTIGYLLPAPLNAVYYIYEKVSERVK